MLKVLRFKKGLFFWEGLQNQGDDNVIVHGGVTSVSHQGNPTVSTHVLLDPGQAPAPVLTTPWASWLNFYSRNTRWWCHIKLYKDPHQTSDSASWICHSPVPKIKWKGEKTALRSPRQPSGNTCLCWQGVADKGENLKNCKHLVFIDLQLVVQIFVSFEVYVRKKVNGFRVDLYYSVQTPSGTIRTYLKIT